MVTICTTSLTFNNSTFCPYSVFMCFVWISEQTAIISLYNINWLVFITETESVYCAVRTGALHKIQVNLGQYKGCRRKSLCCIRSVRECIGICRGKPRNLELEHSNWRPAFTVTWSNLMKSWAEFKTGTVETSEGGHCIVSGTPRVTVCHLVFSLLKTSGKTCLSLSPSKEIPDVCFTKFNVEFCKKRGRGCKPQTWPHFWHPTFSFLKACDSHPVQIWGFYRYVPFWYVTPCRLVKSAANVALKSQMVESALINWLYHTKFIKSYTWSIIVL